MTTTNTNPTLDMAAFSAVCDQAAKIASLLNTRQGAGLGGKLLLILDQHVTNTFPQQIASVQVAQQQRADRVTKQYNALWKEIHTRALGNPAGHDDTAFLDGLSRRLLFPGACAKCRNSYDDYRKAHVPDFTTPATYFHWTVDLHNDVNARIGKPVLTVEQARAIWAAVTTAPGA